MLFRCTTDWDAGKLIVPDAAYPMRALDEVHALHVERVRCRQSGFGEETVDVAAGAFVRRRTQPGE